MKKNEGRNQYKSLLDSLINAIPDSIFYKDCNGVYLGGNNRMSRLTGLKVEDILGTTDYDLFEKSIADGFRDQDRLIIEKLQSIRNEVWHETAAGERALFDTIKTPLMSNEGQVIGILGISRDITVHKNIEQKLAANLDNFRHFFESINDMVFITDGQGKILFNNKAVNEKLGYTHDEIMGRDIPDFHPKEMQPEALRILAEMLTGSIDTCDLPLVRKDGSILPSETRSWFGRWNDQECQFSITKDLSMERELLQRFNKIFDRNPALMAISETKDLIFIDVNESFSRKTGYSKEEIIGKTAFELDLFTIPEEQLPIVREMESKGSVTNKSITIKTKSGEIIHGLFSGEIIENQGKNYFLTVMVDITREKIAEAAQVRQLKLQKILLAASTALISSSIKDVQKVLGKSIEEFAKLILADRAYFLNYDSESGRISTMLGWNAKPEDNSDFKYKKILIQDMPDLFNPLLSKEIFTAENVHGLKPEDPNKKLLHERNIKSIILLPMMSGDDCMGYLVFEYVDTPHTFSPMKINTLKVFTQMATSARNRLIQEKRINVARDDAEAANQAKSQFLANMSHEIRTPLNGITGFLQLLEMKETNPELKEYVSQIKSSTKMLTSVTNDILDLSKIEAGKLEIDEAAFDLKAVVGSVVMTFVALASQKNLAVDLMIGSGVPTRVMGDAIRLKQVISNLVNNAIKFTVSGEILIAVEMIGISEEGYELQFSVKDTGIGMNPETVLKIFDPFSQADSSTTRKYGGTGLGLSICKSLVEMMGGGIQIESEEGKGTILSFAIILEGAKDSNDEVQKDYAQLRNKRILIIDKRATNREIATAYLTEAGCLVSSPDSIAEAVRRLISDQGEHFDAVLLDEGQEHVSGFDLSSTLKIIPSTRFIPMILMMPLDMMADFSKDEAYSGYLTKPYTREDLLDCVSASISGSGNQQILMKDLDVTTAVGDSIPEIKAKILLVEDNEINQNLILKLFQIGGHQCDLAVNGLEAVNACQHNTYDLIFMDCQMPEMDGYEATRIIRSMEGDQRYTPIIAMTAFAMKGDADKCKAVGMDDYLSKPVNLNQISAIIQKYHMNQVKSGNIRDEMNNDGIHSQTPRYLASVLVVDDEPLNLKALTRALSRDYRIRTVTNGLEAIAIASSEEPPDIILLDIMMPEMDGYKVCKTLKEQPGTREIPIVLITGLQDEKIEEDAFHIGAVDFITKPFSLPIVQARIKNHIELKNLRDIQKKNSTTDILTRIPNRRKFDEVLNTEWSRSNRNDAHLSVLMMDIDFFKNFNDSYGHLAGDKCLYGIAQALTRELKRASDFVARWGGEEFACILPETEAREAATIAERLRKAIEGLMIPHESSNIASHVTISIGVTTFNPSENVSAEMLLTRADTGLYKAKKMGRNRIAIN